MLTNIKAIIYDMDGVIIDSEPLWSKAMIEGFNYIGIPFTEAKSKITTGLRFKEVIAFWFEKYNFNTLSIGEFDKMVTDRLCELIKQEGKAKKGLYESLRFFKNKGFKLGIATSSNELLMNTVVDCLDIRNYYDALCSAQRLPYGKPHPQVFLNCATQLQISPSNCLVIEDSVNGLIAGKAAQMRVAAIPEEANKNNPKFTIADYQLNSLSELISEPN